MQELESEPKPKPKRKRTAGGRPRCHFDDLRDKTIEVRLSTREVIALREKAKAAGLTPGRLMRESALSRRLPSPPVPAINREQYAELARLSANVNQLAKLANAGQHVTATNALLLHLAGEVGRLRLSLIGAGDEQ